MRIVLDLQACLASSRHRGIGRYSLSLAQAMARHGSQHSFQIVLNQHFPSAFEEIRSAFDGLIAPESITTFAVPVPLAEIHPANAWRVRAAERVREAFLKQLKPDFVHVSSLFEGLGEDALVSVGALGGAQFDTAVTLYDLIPLLRKDTYLTNPAVRAWYFRKLQSLKNSELLLAISSHSRAEAIEALQLPQHQIVNISSAVDERFQPVRIDQPQRDALRARYGLHRDFVMYTGGIDYRKNIEGLIEAFARLPADTRQQYQLAIVCNIQPEDRERLEKLAATCGLPGGTLVLTGFVPDDDLVALYNLTAVFVFPSLQEGFGLPALEAMSCGAATIGSDSSSIPEVIGRADALFDPTRIDAITGKMHAVLTDGDFRHSLQTHGLRQARRFSWDASAKAALAAFEEVHARRSDAARTALAMPVATLTECAVPVASTRQKRLRLAFVSPLPPEQSGIADYSAQLLPELARHYDIELIVDQETVNDDWALGNFPIRSAAWFDDHAERYDRVLYHFGNSAFHTHMFGNLLRHPGVVVLHDFFLSGIVNHMEGDATWPNAFCRSLYESHGYATLLDELRDGREAAIYRFPCNKPVLDHATGVIVHSRYAMDLARKWYGPTATDGWRYIPLLKPAPTLIDRAAARRLLGIGDDDFLICSFGHLGATKCNDRLIDAWRNSPLAQDPRCQLVFVGANDGAEYGVRITEMIAASADQPAKIRITGFASPEIYRAYLSCADAAVQLRAMSRGETSAAILDCLAYGLPTIVNANGSAAELPDDVLIKLPDTFETAALHDALLLLWRDAGRRKSLALNASRFVRMAHEPFQIGEMYQAVIEQFAADATLTAASELMDCVAAIGTEVEPSAHDLNQLGAAILANQPATDPKQMLIDVTPWIAQDPALPAIAAGRAVLHRLILNPPASYRIEPFHETASGRRYARHFTLNLLGRPELFMEDAPLLLRRGDRVVTFSADTGAIEIRDIGNACSTGLSKDEGEDSAGLAGILCGLRDCHPWRRDVHVDMAEPPRPLPDDEAETAVAVAAAAPVAEQTSRPFAPEGGAVEGSASHGEAKGSGPEPLTRPAVSAAGGGADATGRDAGFVRLEPVARSRPQILVDITMLANTDERSGIQRVVRSILKSLMENPPEGFAVLPVHDAGGYYAHATRFLHGAGADVDAKPEVQDEPIHVNAMDIFLGLDLAPNHVPKNRALYADLNRHGVKIFFVVYDLLPLLHPEVFRAGASPWFAEWLDTVSATADGLVCISRSVADDVLGWLKNTHPERLDALKVGFFHLGADIEASLPTSGMAAGDLALQEQVELRPSFLMVGTLEPRKCHIQALYAFELLWSQGVDANLVIVGKQGWMVDALVEKLRAHPEAGKRLHWLQATSDESLLALYEKASALLACSIAEGFGLPLIEAAIHGLPIIARDLPVFREVCGGHAFYFDGDSAAGLADAIARWMTLDASGQAPQSASMPHLTWSQSAAALTDVVVGGAWHHAPTQPVTAPD